MNKYITLYWVNTHNLKNIDVKIPKNKITVITWISWSWKSSLAFDTVYKEWQFRYIESLSSYLRQFLNLWDRPNIQYSEWLSPSIAIEQNKRVWNIRSTVWTLTESDDYLRLLFAKLWSIYCWNCWSKLQAKTVDQIISDLFRKFEWKRIYIFTKELIFKDKNSLLKWVKKNQRDIEKDKWFTRYIIFYDNIDYVEYFYLETPNIPEDKYPLKVYPIYDKITIKEDRLERLKEDIIKILADNNKFGVLNLELLENNKDFIFYYTDKNFCPTCNISYPEFTSQHFSPNRQEWACEICHWLWKTLQVDWEKIIDPNSTYMEAILPWKDSPLWQAILEKLAYKYDIDPEQKWKDLPDWFKEIVIDWDNELLRVKYWWGKYFSLYYKWIEDVLIQQYNKWVLTADFQAMLSEKDCPECKWARLKKESLSVFINLDDKKYNINDFQNIEIQKLYDIVYKYRKLNKDNILVERILDPLLSRLKTIIDLWLWYLNLYRPIDTLSGGEIQRLRLAKQLGNKLTGIIYVLDEPTIWLDEKEIHNTIKAIKELKRQWNTIIVVEHNEEFIKNADWIIEIGPGAWDFGWKVLFSGPYEEFFKSDTLTAKYIRWEKKIELEEFEVRKTKLDYILEKQNLKWEIIKIKKAHKFNLKNIDIDIPLGSFTIITGPSWAWKTTLMYHILYKFLSEKDKWIQSYIRLELLKQWKSWEDILNFSIVKKEEWEHYQNIALQQFFKELEVESIRGWEKVKNVLYVDQTSIWKTPRSCPATFVGVFDDIRKIFAWTEDAKMYWFNASYFSFNSWKWACVECQWYGYKKVELQFLPDTYIPCPLCKWKRYKPEILEIKRRGMNISDVLDMYIQDAYEFFEDISFIAEKLQLLVEMWLWYLKMWQPAHTLSGWESQRIKLVKHLLKKYKGHTIYFLDEPTVWLHMDDIARFLKVLYKFLEKGDTILMIEHDKNLLKFADKVIRLEWWRVV